MVRPLWAWDCGWYPCYKDIAPQGHLASGYEIFQNTPSTLKLPEEGELRKKKG